MYIRADILIPLGISFVISLVLSPVIIWILKHLKVLQIIRKEGVKAHIRKTGTPTMGGLIIIASIVASSVLYTGKYPNISIILFVTIGFGIIGFMDDYIKVVMKDTKGLSPLQKITAQIVVATVFLFYLYSNSFDIFTYMIPFGGGKSIHLTGILGILLSYMAILGTVNGVNFTDGIDGLAASVTLLVLTFFTVVSICEKSGLEPVTCSAVGGLMGFLVYNAYPARVFMGDTGSLALGGFVVSVAVLMKMPLFLPVVGVIYLLEVLSVIIQVTYFKITHGKRFFKMAPIHHHFELCGLKETQVVVLFSVITAFVCIALLFFM